MIGAFYTVYNTLGYGFLESVYARALYVELRRRGCREKREVTVTAFYEKYPVGHFRVDLLVEDRLAVELKAGRATVPEDRQQLQNWLRASNPIAASRRGRSPSGVAQREPRTRNHER